MNEQAYQQMLISVEGEIGTYLSQSGQTSLFTPGGSVQFVRFASRKHPGVFALVFGWNQTAWGAMGDVRFTLLIDADWKPLRPELIRNITAPEKPLAVKLTEEYQGLVAQFWAAARQWDFSTLANLTNSIRSIQDQAARAGIDPSAFPVPQLSGK